MNENWNKYFLIGIILLLQSCYSESKQNEKTDIIVEFNNIFGNYVNVNNKYDTLKVFESKKMVNVIWHKDSMLHYFEGKFEIAQFSNDPKKLSFCYPKKYGDEVITNCSDIIKENGKIKLFFNSKTYEK